MSYIYLQINDVNLIFLQIFFPTVLHSMTLFNYDQKAPHLGGLLTLVCTVKGPSNVQFYWFKDGAPINTHRTARNMWETRVSSHDEEKHISILNIHGVVGQDEGQTLVMGIRKYEI